MPKLIVVLLNWTLNTQLKMISLGNNVVTFMTNNVGTFATPTVSLTVLKAAADRLQAGYNGRLNGDEARLEYENAGIALDAMLHSQAIYVNGIAKGMHRLLRKQVLNRPAQRRPRKQSLLHQMQQSWVQMLAVV